MKRIDLHIHTLSSPLDEEFNFDIDVLKTHVEKNQLDAIAITNHNLFNAGNFRDVQDALVGVLALPGVEVSVESFHVLVIANPSCLQEFEAACNKVPTIQQGEGGGHLDRCFSPSVW